MGHFVSKNGSKMGQCILYICTLHTSKTHRLQHPRPREWVIGMPRQCSSVMTSPGGVGSLMLKFTLRHAAYPRTPTKSV